MIIVRQPTEHRYAKHQGVATFTTTFCNMCNDGKIKIENVMSSSVRCIEDLKINSDVPRLAADMVVSSTPFKLINTYIVKARLSNTEDLLNELGFGVPLVSIGEYKKLFPPSAKVNSINTDDAEWTDQSILPYLENKFC